MVTGQAMACLHGVHRQVIIEIPMNAYPIAPARMYYRTRNDQLKMSNLLLVAAASPVCTSEISVN